MMNVLDRVVTKARITTLQDGIVAVTSLALDLEDARHQT